MPHISSIVVTRFAPSPTGTLHRGHVLHALYVWGLARAAGAEVLLRMEDHDRQRSKFQYEAAILGDLAWLGFAADGGYVGTCPDMYRQSDHPGRYLAALGQLINHGLVYACNCTRTDLANRTGEQRTNEPENELAYDGFCRDRNLAWGVNTGLRFRLPDETIHFTDTLMGPQTQHPASQCGDVLLVDRLGQFTYQFAVVVDDLTMGVDWVIRGADLLASTGRQVILGRLLGREAPPQYTHHPLLKDPTGRKLAKRDLSESRLRRDGLSPEALLGEVAFAGGLQASIQPITQEEIVRLFA